jgi:hypothetical protein
MKMNFLFGHIFWGVLLLLWGLSLILKGFNIVDLPLVKIFLAVIIIMFGIRLLIGGWGTGKVSGIHSHVSTSGSHEYTSVFGSQTVDLTDLNPNSRPLDVTAVFGGAYVELPDDIDFEIHPTAVFGSTVVPPKPNFGNIPALGVVKIEANAVFGKVEFVYKPAKRAPNFRSAAKPDTTAGATPDSL